MQQPGQRAPAPDSLRLVQELVNTLDVETGHDRLTIPGGLEDFRTLLADRGLPGIALDAGDLPELCALREALRAACLAHSGTDVPAATLAALDRLLTAAPLVLALDAAGGAALRPAPGLTGLPALTAAIAAGIIAAGRDWNRLKACVAEDCQWAYYDRSPAGRSRWCSMAVCGSRAKMRTYRGRGGA
ncbi:CGNR zinc finger domain-containing protein [Streptomyces palmae]|uniref:CGNR zinc finger domain-containing protein n=1 Tax=Streptomyces palmae TaxID=1701085 RepID=UPI001FD85277|nr:CGNR zinc finger domain-containing protein [Streptomyces palmae]